MNKHRISKNLRKPIFYSVGRILLMKIENETTVDDECCTIVGSKSWDNR